MHPSFAFIDILLIAGYFFSLLWVGFRTRSTSLSSSDDFLIAGRTVTLPAFVATLVSTWYGGILGIGEFSYQYGLSTWLVFGVPYYVFALVFSLTLAKKVRATALLTIPDKLSASYDLKTALLGAGLTFVLVTPSAYVLMLGVLIQFMFSWSLATSVVLGSLVTVIFLFTGGFRAGVRANVLQFIMMFAGFVLILPFAYMQYGGWSFLQSHLPPLHLTWHGGHTMQYIIVWFFIAMWTLVDPSFHQRCYAAKSPAVAQRGILVSILFWLLFDFLTSFAGLYSRAILPDLQQPAFSYPMLAETVLPPLAKGLFYIGLLATIMSTLSSYTFTAGMTLGYDIVGRLSRTQGEAREERLRRWTNMGMALTMVLAIAMALWLASVVKIWYVVGTTIIPGLLVPLLASYYRPLQLHPSRGFSVMLTGWAVSTVWFAAGLINGGEFWFGIEPMYSGLAGSLLIASWDWFRRKT
jgi:solute:Na+ symporter, SSS family